VAPMPAGVASPPAKIYQSVRKHGRTTLHTVGVIMDLSVRIKARYGTRIATFDNQLGIVGAGGSFSSGRGVLGRLLAFQRIDALFGGHQKAGETEHSGVE
jgi:hypothetical protein